MSLTVKAKIRSVILSTGLAILCLGGYLLTAGSMIKQHLQGDSSYLKQQNHHGIPRYSGYWTGPPVMITGILLLATSWTKKQTSWLQVVCVIFLLVSMVVTLGVISEEGANETYVHNLSKGRHCAGYQGYVSKEDCENGKAAAVWYQILLVSANVLLVVYNVALLAIFAAWMLFASKQQQQQLKGNQDAEDGYYTATCRTNTVDVNNDGVLLSFKEHSSEQDYAAKFVQI